MPFLEEADKYLYTVCLAMVYDCKSVRICDAIIVTIRYIYNCHMRVCCWYSSHAYSSTSRQVFVVGIIEEILWWNSTVSCIDSCSQAGRLHAARRQIDQFQSLYN